jgi:hypothetical protein
MKKSTTYKGQVKPYGKSGHFHESRRHSLQAKGIRTGRFKEIEFLCANPEYPKFKELKHGHENLFNDLKKIDGVIPYRQHFDDLDGTYSLSVILLDDDAKSKVKKLAEKYGVGIDLENVRDKEFAERVLKGELDYQITKPSQKDIDKDGVPDTEDCEPFNPEKQGLLHEAKVQNARLFWWSKFMATPPTSLLSEKRWQKQLKSFPYSHDRNKNGVPDYFDLKVKGD